MTELSSGDDGFLRMDRFSDAEIDGDELGDEPWYADAEPLGAAAWSRVLAGAVSDTDPRPELDDLVAPAPAELVPDGGDPATDDAGPDGDPVFDEIGPGLAAPHDGWGGDGSGHGHDGGAHEFGPHDAHGTAEG
jgi:hypothetical protein